MTERLPLAVRREALLRQCAEQRDQLALQAHALRAPLDGGPVGGLRGLLARVKASPRGVKLGVPLALAGVLGGVTLVRRRKRANAAHAATTASSPATPLITRALALWSSVQPLVALLRR